MDKQGVDTEATVVNEKEKGMIIITDKFKKKLFRDFLLEKSLKFADCIQDDDHEAAKAIFEKPFQEEADNDAAAAKQEDGAADSENRKRVLPLGGGGMADIELIKTLKNEPVFDRADLNKVVTASLTKQGAKPLSDMEKLVLKFRMYMLISADDEQRNVLHIACRSGSPLIEFIVE